MEQVDGRPQQVLEIGFEARVRKRRDERVEDVDDGSSDDAGVRQWSRVGLILEGTVAVELKLGEDVLGRR
jgi:hypothetical protein